MVNRINSTSPFMANCIGQKMSHSIQVCELKCADPFHRFLLLILSSSLFLFFFSFFSNRDIQIIALLRKLK